MLDLLLLASGVLVTVACLEVVVPESCSEEEVRGVDIFYNVALASVVPKLKERLISTQSGVLEMLGNDPGRWESSMAYAIVLIDKMSSLKNIKENVENLEGNTRKKRGKMLTLMKRSMRLPVCSICNLMSL